jgi:hypothetical protein
MDLLKQIKEFYDLTRGYNHLGAPTQLIEEETEKEPVQQIEKKTGEISGADKNIKQLSAKRAHEIVS